MQNNNNNIDLTMQANPIKLPRKTIIDNSYISGSVTILSSSLTISLKLYPTATNNLFNPRAKKPSWDLSHAL